MDPSDKTPAATGPGWDSSTTYSASERKKHMTFMKEALAMAELALNTDETPVGCVFVYNDIVVARGMNATNRTRNGTRHAEFIALNDLLAPSYHSSAPVPVSTSTSSDPISSSPSSRRNPDVPKHFTQELLAQTDLYVTVEPCIMCASLLRQFGIRKVYYGASNDKFGGTGGVLSVHGKDGGDVERGYAVSGGWGREEAVNLLRRFYVQENGKAPEPRKKERVLKLLETGEETEGV